MNEAYHKARKQFALFSAILIAWEYIGISVGMPGPYTATIPYIENDIAFRNPEVIPTIIFVLVVYFAIRFTIEWQRCIVDEPPPI